MASCSRYELNIQMETEIQKKINKNGMIISRIPRWVRDEIISEALWHSDDYGEAIAQFIREAMEYRLLKEKFIGGELSINLSQTQPTEEVEQNTEEIKMANGKTIKYNGGQNE